MNHMHFIGDLCVCVVLIGAGRLNHGRKSLYDILFVQMQTI